MIRLNNVKKIIFILICFVSSLSSQIKDRFDLENLSFGFIINPVFEVSRINNKNADFVGFQIGLISRDNEIGFSLQKLNSMITHDIVDLDTRLKFDILSGDIYYNKYFNIYKELYLSVGTSLGCAYTQLKFKGNLMDESSSPPCCWRNVFASDTYYFFKPHIDLDYYLYKAVLINIGLGYRIIGGLKMDYRKHPYAIDFSNRDFSNYFLSFSIKYVFVLR